MEGRSRKNRRDARRCDRWIVAGALVLLVGPSTCFYLPGIHPVDWKAGERVPVRAAKLSSSATHIPYDFYSIPFCEPEDGPQTFAQNLGEVRKKKNNSSHTPRCGDQGKRSRRTKTNVRREIEADSFAHDPRRTLIGAFRRCIAQLRVQLALLEEPNLHRALYHRQL